MKIWYRKNTKGAAAEQKYAEIICYFQKQYYKNVNARKKIEYGVDYWLSESFRQGAT
jgi:hypothetical protein